jgi:hypothetical protein
MWRERLQSALRSGSRLPVGEIQLLNWPPRLVDIVSAGLSSRLAALTRCDEGESHVDRPRLCRRDDEHGVVRRRFLR